MKLVRNGHRSCPMPSHPKPQRAPPRKLRIQSIGMWYATACYFNNFLFYKPEICRKIGDVIFFNHFFCFAVEVLFSVLWLVKTFLALGNPKIHTNEYFTTIPFQIQFNSVHTVITYSRRFIIIRFPYPCLRDLFP
jgi:hypothetical protein